MKTESTLVVACRLGRRAGASIKVASSRITSVGAASHRAQRWIGQILAGGRHREQLPMPGAT